LDVEVRWDKQEYRILKRNPLAKRITAKGIND
jgi:hypothetical protein